MDYLTDCIETLRRRIQMAEKDRSNYVAKRAWSADDEAMVDEIDEFLAWAATEMEKLREALWAAALTEDDAECPRTR